VGGGEGGCTRCMWCLKGRAFGHVCARQQAYMSWVVCVWGGATVHKVCMFVFEGEGERQASRTNFSGCADVEGVCDTPCAATAADSEHTC
jgi:hypothetical protein